MSDNNGAFGFGKFVPGFDFLQNLAKGASDALPQMPNISSWVAPTLNVEELDKRITELKAVHFWLDQNGKALSATIQALEVQKMTLATLKGMNFSMGEVANALKLKTPEPVESAPKAAKPKAAPSAKPKGNGEAKANGGGATGAVDPLQWWGALTQQFQEIASNAMKDVAQKTAVDTARNMAGGIAKEAVKAAKKTVAAKARSATRKTKTQAAAD
ncbi:hypothetical protein LZ009_18840 [Ramlibacter sp. XY19]|uniref:PhaM family polyhydroxyalkanoate granule multifunctional regulatory protein n=1 Tax=Ramlibacter paludis TaxID=2908000 RepID=UPI0023DA3A43|nr:PhaM family polyhydroxyalkanoate granule multifunctional regulatory protein [Ramlibacter paludis]MCG2594841.1 hypothetical protein [Ramlibacter paludis]